MEQERRRGFTLVELLVVIGIIVVLIAIVAMGVRHTAHMAARHETEAELKVCVDLLREYQSINGMKSIEGPVESVTGTQMDLPYPPYLNHSYKLPIYIDEPVGSTAEVTQPFQPDKSQSAISLKNLAGAPNPNNSGQPRSIDAGDMTDKSSGNNPRWGASAVYNTFGVMYVLLKNPKNRAIVEGLPPKRILETWAPFTPGDPPQKPFIIDAAILLDGWGNPIIFVPRGGIHVRMDPQNTGTVDEYLVRTSGTTLLKNGGLANIPPISPLDRPFFASAGPDGYFADLTGGQANRKDRSSDNMYSFQSQ